MKHTPIDFIEMAQRHKDADQLTRGSFEWNGSSCSVGCFNHDLEQEPGDFEALSKATGYPKWAHRLQEAVFEGLPNSEGADWHVNFFTVAAGVKDWTSTYHSTMIAILETILTLDTSEGQVVQSVIDLHKRGPEVTDKEWAAARDAAGDVARAAARDAAWAAAGDAAWDAAGDAAGAAARAAAYKKIASGFVAAAKAAS